ncbi:MAG: Fe-S oxidoreductase [Candidatus Thorarchaeota archaeon]|nr:MAG: Fe-S oxidoreductase [Candidatus Thorarchaeota archaeon]
MRRTRGDIDLDQDTKNPVAPLKAKSNVLLVEPMFPVPNKSKNHKDFLPVGLLKIGAWLTDEGHRVRLVRGNIPESKLDFTPDEIWITSLFTYWSKYVIETAKHYRGFRGRPRLVVGGIYASLMPEHCREETGCDVVFKGVHPLAEEYYPDYALLDNGLDIQIVHASRGCIHKCKFCGVHIIEPDGLKSAPSIIPLIATPRPGEKRVHVQDIESDDYEIERRNLVFYDNNLLANENIERILRELAYLKRLRKIGWCESQSGFDGRVMQKQPHLARMLREAGFKDPRIAWDWGMSQEGSIKRQIDLLREAGYQSKDIFVFMLYNWGIPFEEMERKRIKCFEWKVQIADCRYRPLNQTYDEYRPGKKNQLRGYYVHTKKGWTDALVKQFRRNVRRQNICVRHDQLIYSRAFETKKASREQIHEVNAVELPEEKIEALQRMGFDYWNPAEFTPPEDYDPTKLRPLQTTIEEYL